MRDVFDHFSFYVVPHTCNFPRTPSLFFFCRYVDLRGAHLLVEKLCTGDFFFHGPSEGQISDEHVFQSLASGKGASSTEACAAAAAVPQLLVVASSEGGNEGGDLGLSLGTPFLASRGLAQMPSEQLRDLLGSSSAATRLMAAGIAVSD